MRFQRKILFGLFVGLLMLFSASQAPTLASELTTPERVNETITLNAQLANNIYLSNYNLLSSLGTTVRSDEGGVLSTVTGDLNAPNPLGTKSAHTAFSLPTSPDNVAQFSNITNDPLSLDLSVNYLHLMGNSSASSIENTVLFSGEQHIFSMNLTAGIPYALSMNIHGNAQSETLTLKIISPSTTTDTSIITLYTHLTNIETFIPYENGTHLFILQPSSGDIIVDKLVVYKNISVISINSGYSEILDGTSSTLKIFKLAINTTVPLSLLSFDQFTYVSQYIDDYVRNANLLGVIRLKVFSSNSHNILGTAGATSMLITPGDVVYVAVEALPPDSADPYVLGEKARLGLPDGFYAEYSFWTELEPLSAIPTNVDTTIEPQNSVISNIYYYTTSVPVSVSFNSTGTSVDARIYTAQATYISSLNNVNLYSGSVSTMVILEPGTYYISVTDALLDGSGSFRFSPYAIQTLDMGSTTITYSLNDIAIYQLPANGLTKDVLNITYLDYLNISATFSLKIYDGEGISKVLQTYTFDQYANNADPYYAQNNNTAIGFSSTSLGNHNFNGLYLAVFYKSNTVWNSSLAVPTAISTDNSSYSARLQIVREDYWATRSFNSTDYEYVQAALGTSYTHALNATKTESLFRFTFTPRVGGNRLIFNAENMTYSFIMASDIADTWYSGSPVTTTINNQTVYQVDFAFPSVGVPVGIVLYFSGTYTDNGTLSVIVSDVAPFDLLSYYSFHALTAQNVPTAGSGGDSDLVVDDNTSTSTPESGNSLTPWYIGGGVIAVAALGGGGFAFYKKRK